MVLSDKVKIDYVICVNGDKQFNYLIDKRLDCFLFASEKTKKEYT